MFLMTMMYGYAAVLKMGLGQAFVYRVHTLMLSLTCCGLTDSSAARVLLDGSYTLVNQGCGYSHFVFSVDYSTLYRISLRDQVIPKVS